MSALRQYIGNLKLNRNIGQLIAATEELVTIKSGMSKSRTQIPTDKRY